jgi:hypothetical protein
VRLSGALVLALLLAASAARAEELPRPKAGAIPLELGQIAEATGPNLRLADAPLDVVGNRVRFTGRIADLGKTSAGESFIVFEEEGDRLVFRLPGPLESPERLDRSETWEVIVRIDRRVALADGRDALAVGPDILVKTPAPPGEIHPGDVIVTVAGDEMFEDPGLEPWVAEEPQYRLRVTKPGSGEFNKPAETAMAVSKDERGRTTMDYRVNTSAEDGRKRSARCLYRVEGGRLRNVGYGAVELSPAGEQLRHEWVDFERDRYQDTWSARKKPFPANTYGGECLGFAIGGFPFDRATVVRFYTWGGRGNPVPLYAYVDGEETVDVRGRAEPAKIVRMGLDVRQAARDIDLPEMWRRGAEAAGESWHQGDSRYWISPKKPQVVLRFVGPFGPPGSIEGELTRVR